MRPFYLVLMALVSLSCSKPPPGRYAIEHYDAMRSVYPVKDSCNGTEFIADVIEIRIPEWNERPYADTVRSLLSQAHVDDRGITMHKYTDRLSYHPVAMCTRALALIDLYNRLKNPEDLELARAHADKLIGLGYEIDYCLLFPYNYKYTLYERDHMKAPWFSAMAQGQALSVFSRLYEVAGEEKYRVAAAQVYRSLYRMKSQHEPWVSCVDEKGNLWFEEYPHERPSHVLNGMIWAIYGVHDYYVVERTSEVKELLQASLSTIIKHGDQFRDTLSDSFYCLKYDVKNPYYHEVHIRQLRTLYRLTGDVRFDQMADRFREDK